MKNLIAWLASIKKTLVAVGNALIVTGEAVSDGQVSGDEWMLILAAWAAAIGVYQVTNLVGSVYRKK